MQINSHNPSLKKSSAKAKKANHTQDKSPSKTLRKTPKKL